MNATKRTPVFLALLALLVCGSAVAATPRPFTATYQVLRGGSPIGESTLTLKAAGGGQWSYASSMRGTSGLAALLGANVEETSRFRWHGNRPEAVRYDYAMDAAIKHKRRHLSVDWAATRVVVDDGRKGRFDYPSQAGLVERHLLPLALGYALDAGGSNEITLPVAVQNRVQMQHFKVSGRDAVDVPAGHFNALRVDRSDDDKGFTAWYMPRRYPVPVKLAQTDGGDITMLLKSFRSK